MATAHLVIICNPETNAPICAEIWSSPEWKQSRTLPQRVFVLFEVEGENFQKAHDRMMEYLPNYPRYAWAIPLLGKSRKEFVQPVYTVIRFVRNLPDIKAFENGCFGRFANHDEAKEFVDKVAPCWDKQFPPIDGYRSWEWSTVPLH